jgi:methylenetetrahydrofolate dehydrogenase (NADP+)/methenyltetrahydrofolate cyclohydrolase
MPANILDGKTLAADLRAKVKEEVEHLKATRGITPGLGALLVGDDPASATYVGMKRRACEAAGMVSKLRQLPDSASYEQVRDAIQSFNDDPEIHGILVQHPLPKHLDEDALFAAIQPQKDADGVNPISLGWLLLDKPTFAAATAAAVMGLIDHTDIDPKGKEAVVVGRSKIVGKPAALLLLARHATVTICHSRTQNLADVCRRADILVVAVNRPKMITGDMVKDGAIVIDVGYSRDEKTGAHFGDVDFASASEKASWITPVPGGVGPMTIAMLLRNTLEAAKRFGK